MLPQEDSKPPENSLPVSQLQTPPHHPLWVHPKTESHWLCLNWCLSSSHPHCSAEDSLGRKITDWELFSEHSERWSWMKDSSQLIRALLSHLPTASSCRGFENIGSSLQMLSPLVCLLPDPWQPLQKVLKVSALAYLTQELTKKGRNKAQIRSTNTKTSTWQEANLTDYKLLSQ